MYLIADGGSTKVDWVLLDNNKEKLRFQTIGLNPAILSITEIKKRLYTITELQTLQKDIQAIFFYGAGCSQQKSKELQQLFSSVFINAKIEVKEDTYAAANAILSSKPSIVCILGTGSNSSYFDGINLHTTPSLGYVIMDEASGNYFGKKLIQDYYYNKMPKPIANSFSDAYDLSPDEIKKNLYKKESPNMYLASFAEYMFTEKDNTYITQIIKDGFQVFIDNKIKTKENYKHLPIHFIGSVAYYFKDILKQTLKQNDLQLGKVIQKPIDNLIIYHQNLIN